MRTIIRPACALMVWIVLLFAASLDAADKSAAQKTWEEGVAKVSRVKDPETRLRGIGVPVTAANLARHRRCESTLVAAFQRALTQGHSSAERTDYFTIEIPACERRKLTVTYTYINGGPAAFTLSELPPSWRVVTVSIRDWASTLTVMTDSATGCAFQFDTIDPFQAIGSAQPGLAQVQ